MTPADDEIDLFILNTGFHYYFATLLIDYLGLEHVAFAMFQPREGIERRAAAAGHRVAFADRDDPVTGRFGKKAGKWRFATRAFRELELSGKRVRLFSAYYNDSFVYALRGRLERRCAFVEYNMIPDGAALLRHIPGKPHGSAASWFGRLLYRVEPADIRNKTGSYSGFLNTIYHFPAAVIHADPAKLHIVPVPKIERPRSGEVLVLGGLSGISHAFVATALQTAAGRPVRYRMHPRMRRGVEIIREEAPQWEELELMGILEEHLLAHPYDLVIGGYSSAVVFNQLFVSGSRSIFLVDRAEEDADYHKTADACGIPVTLL